MLVIGHRGAAGEAPENTVEGFRHAISRGCRHFELDVHLSSDNKLVVVHDTTVDRTTWRTGPVSSFRAAELGKMDTRRNGPPWPRKTGIATLDKILGSAPEAKSFQLEIKKGPDAKMRQVAEKLAERFPNRRSAKGITVTSMSKSLHRHLAKLAPHLRRGLVTTVEDAHLELVEGNYQLLALAWPRCNKKVVKAAHKLGVEVSVWTVNDPMAIRQMHADGVDSIITDYPSMALPLVATLLRV